MRPASTCWYFKIGDNRFLFIFVHFTSLIMTAAWEKSYWAGTWEKGHGFWVCCFSMRIRTPCLSYRHAFLPEAISRAVLHVCEQLKLWRDWTYAGSIDAYAFKESSDKLIHLHSLIMILVYSWWNIDCYKIYSIWCATHEMGSFVICGQRRTWSACAEAQADLGLRYLLTESVDTAVHVYVDEQKMLRLDCTDAHGELDLCRRQNV